VLTQALWRQVQALVLADRGQFAHAEPLAREAVALTNRTDSLNTQGDALCDLAEVLAMAGRTEDAIVQLEHALRSYGQKGNLASVGRTRARLEEVQAAG
jgi:tetratricopeptide (TPR) repeat protein